MLALAALPLQRHQTPHSKSPLCFAVPLQIHLYLVQSLPQALVHQHQRADLVRRPRSRREPPRRAVYMLLLVTARDEQSWSRMSEREKKERLKGQRGESESWVAYWVRVHLNKLA